LSPPARTRSWNSTALAGINSADGSGCRTISLLHLPPYSPELNPVENVWQYLKQDYLSNRVFDTYEDIVDACCEAWNKLMAMPDSIASICTREWANQVTA